MHLQVACWPVKDGMLAVCQSNCLHIVQLNSQAAAQHHECKELRSVSWTESISALRLKILSISDNVDYGG